MSPWLITLALLAGFVLLVLGAEMLVKGATRLAERVRISRLVIGLTVVAFGTSAPELAVTLSAAWKGSADLALGNVVGSNIFNVLGILGLSALAAPLVVHRQLIRMDLPLMVALSIGVLLLAWDGRISTFDGALLAAVLLVYVWWSIRLGRREATRDDLEAPPEPTGSVARDLGLLAVGLVLLVVGSQALVAGATALARAFGVTELVIGLTVVAVGTSLPEVATSVMATLRGQRDIAIGNVVGSNIFNILCVLGLGALIAPGGLTAAPSAIAFDLPVMIAVAAVCLPVFFSGLISRREGALFLLAYIGYATFLVLDAKDHALQDEFGEVMLYAVVPGMVLLIAIGFLDALKKRQEARLRGN